MWWWFTSVTVICSIFVLCFVIGYLILYWKRDKVKLLLSDNENIKYEQKYILTSSAYHKREVTSGIPCSSSEPMNIQPHPKVLQSMDVLMFTDNKIINNSNLQTSPEYKIPLISHYESGKTNQLRKWRKNRQRNLKNSFGPKSSAVIETQTVTTTQVADSNANFAENGSNPKPELTFSIFYDSPSKELHVTVISSSNLPVLRRTGSTQYFRVRVCVGACDTQWYETRYVRGSRELHFSETFIVSGLVHHKLRECMIRFVVVEFEEFQHCWTVVGEVRQTLIDLRANSLLKETKTLH